MSGTSDVDLGAVSLTFPRQPVFLRLVRLAAADAGARAELPIEDVEDLKIAVDELTYALIGDDADGASAAETLTLRYSAMPGRVEVEGTGAVVGGPLVLNDLSRNIISAVVDEYDIVDEGGVRRFRLVKRSQT